MYLDAHLEVIVANKRLTSVIGVHATNDGHQVGGECDVVVPLNCRIQYLDGAHDYLTQYTRVLFNVGDPITVRARYTDYDWQTIFEGFVFDFIEGMPMTMKCLDYIYFFNLGTMSISYKSVSFKSLLEDVIAFVNKSITTKLPGTKPVELVLPMPEIELVNITFSMMSPRAILEWFKKELGFNISLNGNQLYVNIASNTTTVIKYDTSRNVTKTDLQKPAATFLSFKVKAWFIREDGTKDSFEVGDSDGQLREVYFYRVARNEALYKQLAEEALVKVKQVSYGGSITTPLYPQPVLFAKAEYTDVRYPAKSGNYVITGISFSADQSGYRYTLKFAYLTEANVGV